MENAVHVVATAKMRQRRSVQAVLSLLPAALMRWLCKSLMEFGEGFQKMIAPQFWNAKESHR
jgi:hypothetical protein